MSLSYENLNFYSFSFPLSQTSENTHADAEILFELQWLCSDGDALEGCISYFSKYT